MSEITNPTSQEVKWASPVKPKATSRSQGITSHVAKKLLFTESNESEPKDDLLKTYPLASLGLQQGLDLTQQAYLIELVENLEMSVREEVPQERQSEIRSYINNLLVAAIPFEEKYQKLGITLFYLDRDGVLPTRGFLIPFRADEMIGEIQSYLSARSDATSNPLIPSGKTHYLLRSFAHMAMTSRQYFNRAGLFVVKSLLESPSHGIAGYLQPEHREHILIVIRELLLNPTFNTFFRKEVTVHPDLVDVLQIDLKWSSTILSVHIFYACLIALFSDIRQSDNPNCYAVSALIYVTETETYRAFARLIRWIEEGHYRFIGSSIPLRPFLEKRIVRSTDLDIQVANPEALALAPLEQIYSILSLSHSPSSKRKATLKELLPSNTARTLFQSYKSNLLIQMMLKVLEFTNENLVTEEEDAGQSFKVKLIKSAIGVLEWLSMSKGISSLICEKLESHLMKKFWLEPQREEGEVIASRQAEEEGARLFSACLRVYYLNGGRYTLLPSLSEFQRVLLEEVNTLCATEQWDPHVSSTLCEAIQSAAFRTGFAKRLASQIEYSTITGDLLDRADLLIMRQRGGSGALVLKSVFDINLQKESLPESLTPYEFLRNLVEFISTRVATKEFREAPKVLIRNPGKHIWTLSPSCWKLLIDNRISFSFFIQRSLFDPGRRRLDAAVPADAVIRLISSFAGNEEVEKFMMSHFQYRPNLSYAQFRDELLLHTQDKNRRRMEECIRDEFSRVTLDLAPLLLILQEIKLTLPEQTVIRLLEALPIQPCQPYELALLIRKALLDHKLAIIDPYELEIAICKAFDMPIAIQIGDLNWQNMRQEDPSHLRLIVQFNWILEVPSYYIRGESEDREPAKYYTNFDIFSSPELLK